MQPQECFHEFDIDQYITVDIEVDYEHLEEQLEKLMEFLKIDCEEYKENFSYLWAGEINEVEHIFIDLAVSAWKVTKEEANSQLLGFMVEGTGIYDFRNLDSGEITPSFEDIILSVKKSGLKIEPRQGY